MVQKINSSLLNEKYIKAYELMKYLNIIYPDVNDYIESNINILKTDLDLQNSNRRAKLILEIINNKFH